MIRNSPGWVKNSSSPAVMTTSTSRNKAVPCSPCRSALKVSSLFQPRSGMPAGSASGGMGRGGYGEALHFAADAGAVVGQADKTKLAPRVPPHHRIEPVDIFGAVFRAPFHAQDMARPGRAGRFCQEAHPLAWRFLT